MARRHTVTKRCSLNICFFVWMLWDTVVRAALRTKCQTLLDEIDSAAATLADFEQQCGNAVELRSHEESSRQDMRKEVLKKVEEVEALRAGINDALARNAGLAYTLGSERRVAEGLRRDRLLLHEDPADLEGSELGLRSPLATRVVQLAEALEVEVNLRFSLQRAEAEASHALEAKAAAETQVQELQRSLQESRQMYMKTVDALDQRVAELTQEGKEAQQAALQLQHAVADAAFRARMCDLELQRWQPL